MWIVQDLRAWDHRKRQRSGKSSVERSNPGLSFRLFQICFVDAKFSATGTSEQHSDMWHSSKGWQKAWRSILTNYCRGILIYFEQHSDIDTLPPCCTTFQNLNLVATWSLESASVWNLENQNQNHNIYIYIIVWFSFWKARPIFKWSWQFHHLNARILLVDWPSFSIRFLEVSFKSAVFQDLESRNMFHSCFFCHLCSPF